VRSNRARADAVPACNAAPPAPLCTPFTNPSRENARAKFIDRRAKGVLRGARGAASVNRNALLVAVADARHDIPVVLADSFQIPWGYVGGKFPKACWHP
jgi:hypothetical protein